MTMSVADNLELVRRAYAAFSAGDIDTLSGLLAPDVVHSVPGSSVLSGDHKGLPNVLTLYGQLAERSGGTVRVDLEDVLSDGGDRVIAIHVATAERDGKKLAAREALLFTIAGDQVAEIQDFFSDIESNDLFWT
jgi:ketosteroid isomerase-like protein